MSLTAVQYAGPDSSAVLIVDLSWTFLSSLDPPTPVYGYSTTMDVSCHGAPSVELSCAGGSS